MSMLYTIIIENKAQKEFLKISPPINKAIRKAINNLENEPRPRGVKKLIGSKNGFRVRAGDYRILYTIDDHRHIITIYRIRYRKEVYR